METSSHKYEVVPLTEEYLDWAIDVAYRNMLCDEVGKPELYNPTHLFSLARKAMEAGVCLVATHNSEPVGIICGFVIPNLYNPEYTTLAELVWYVLPEYRKTRAALSLLREWELAARNLNVDELTLSLLPTSGVGLEKRGFTLAEYSYRKEI